MHYRNGKEAKNGDKIVQIGYNGEIAAIGILYGATAGNDYCNGNIASIQNVPFGACLIDCITVEDLAEILKEKGLEKRPKGK
jgi:hypothetical protein